MKPQFKFNGSFNHSSAAVARYPAPVREIYFTPEDYAAACKRTHEGRVKFDKQTSAWRK